MGPSPASEVTLFTHRFSYFSQTVDLALTEKGIPYKRVLVDLANKPKELLEVNPLYATVPSLVHNGNPVLESLIILEYLEDAWPDRVPLLPKDPIARAKVRFWADYIHKGFQDVRKAAFFTKKGSPEQQAALAKLPNFFKTIDATITEYSAEGPFFTGDKFGYLDVILGPWVDFSVLAEKLADFTPGGPDKLPRLSKWTEALRAHKSVQEALPSVDEATRFASTWGTP